MGPRKVRWVVLAVIAGLLATLIGWLFAPRAVAVDTAMATEGPIAEVVEDQGAVRVREAYVVAAPVTGRLQRIDLEVGDRIRGGEIVATIQPAESELLDPRTRAQAEAAVAAASAAVDTALAEQVRVQAEVRRAEAALNRIRVLTGKDFASKQALDDAEAASREANASLRAAQAATLARRADLTRARAMLADPAPSAGRPVAVQAPAGGYITRVLQESARTIPAGVPLVEIGDDNGLEAAVEFLSQDAVRMREGMEAEIFDWGGAGPLPARVRRIEPQGFTKVSALGVDEQRVLVMLQLSGDPAGWSRLGPGYRVWGRVFLRRAPKVLSVPVGALVRADGGWAVFRIERGRAELTRIRVGAITDDAAEVTAGLNRGQAVVVLPSDKVADGVRVRSRP